MGDLTAALKRENVEIGGSRVSPDQLAALVRLIGGGKLSGPGAKQIFAEMWKTGGDPEAIMNTRGLAQVSDESAITAAVDEVIAANAKAVADYKAGNARILGFLVGQVVRKLGGKADAAIVNRILAERLG
jgi:aspartyl-tRNA(Asn)/glutamyl-tRNA(Gln) amidotransferase subunit B